MITLTPWLPGVPPPGDHLEQAQAVVPSLYRKLSLQIIHRDYDPSNILMEENKVTGVLDFEFCGPDLRILDLAYALSQWPSGWWHTGKEWNIINYSYLLHKS